MFSRLLNTLRTWYALAQYKTQKHPTPPHRMQLTYTEAKTIQAFRGLGAQTNLPTRLGQAAQLEAFNVPNHLVQIFLDISAQGAITQDDLDQLNHYGITVHNSAKIQRLQTTVSTLAPLAGPGFTTQDLINDGLLHEGDL